MHSFLFLARLLMRENVVNVRAALVVSLQEQNLTILNVAYYFAPQSMQCL